MRINEVERQAGITKKNIRFYEEQGLLSPKRNSENGYREYAEEDVHTLRRIKLMRKLGVPIGEIRRMLQGKCTVGDGMRRHIITLEREQQNLEQSVALCKQLQSVDAPLDELDADEILTRMEEMERSGASFHNKQNQDVRVRYVAPVVVTVIMVGLMLAMTFLILWAYFEVPENSPPFWFVLVIAAMFLAVGGGVILALVQRLKEIEGGEEDAASEY